MPLTRGDLLRSCWVTRRPTTLWHGNDVPVPPSLPVAPLANAPPGPLAPPAVGWHAHIVARRHCARRGLRQVLGTRCATMRGLDQYFTAAQHLAGPAGGITAPPSRPRGQLAVDRARSLAIGAVNAGHRLLQWPLAEPAIPAAMDVYHTLSRLHATACCGALGEGPPIPEDAVHGGLARDLIVTWLVLDGHAFGRLATVVGVLGNRARSGGEAAAARCGALAPLCPGAPNLVDANDATGLQVARLRLSRIERLAGLAARCRFLLNLALTAPLTAATLRRALGPHGPLSPDTVLAGVAFLRMLVAGLRLHKQSVEAVPALMR
mmetsp:Transcript_9367/g.24193  ORF Transcript_9367/g.24193 Transcript_9367/m.24193 type:complete len:321 (-) Transcript_9367:4356-5318(-)